MTTLFWIIALVVMASFGSFATRLRVVEDLHRPAQVALLLATTVIGGTLMFIESAIGIPWSRATLLIPLIATAGLMHIPSGSTTESRKWVGIAMITLLLAYAVITGRATSPDLLYFWGPKGVHFFRAGRIDAAFLSAPEHLLMHSDYPPMLPIVYTFASTLTNGFSWWGAILTEVIYFMAAIALFHALAARSLGRSRATLYATLLAATLAFGYVHTSAAGGAEPLLILFEVTALSLLTFADDIPGTTLLASIALLGAILTKVEGAIFAAAAVIAFALTRHAARRVIQLAAPAAIGLGAWVVFSARFGLLDSYRSKPLFATQTANVFGAMLRMASYRAAYVPWIACIAPILLGRAWKRASLPLLVAGLFAAGLFFVYLHSPDAGGWINTSAERVLLSTLIALVVAASASSPLLPD